MKNTKGFTLVELLVVISIIGVLSLMGLRLYLTQLDKAKNAIVKANVGTVQTLIQAELADDADTFTLTKAKSVAGNTKIHNPYAGGIQTDFTTPGEGKVIVTGSDGGPFTITGYGKDGTALPDILTARR